jgi:hypothetical protein
MRLFSQLPPRLERNYKVGLPYSLGNKPYLALNEVENQVHVGQSTILATVPTYNTEPNKTIFAQPRNFPGATITLE